MPSMMVPRHHPDWGRTSPCDQGPDSLSSSVHPAPQESCHKLPSQCYLTFLPRSRRSPSPIMLHPPCRANPDVDLSRIPCKLHRCV